MTGLIYKATNVITKQTYVGQTTQTLQQRKNAHLSDANIKKTSMYFHRALKKYGSDKFEWEVIVDNVPIHLLDDLEINCIAMEDAFTKGYNLCPGGNSNRGWKASEATRKNMSKAQKGRTFTKEAMCKMSKAQTGTKSHKFKPWYMVKPDGTKSEFYNITIKEYAKLNGFSYGNLIYRVRDQDGVAATKGFLKGYTFGIIKDNNE